MSKNALRKRVENIEKEAKERTHNQKDGGQVLIYKRGEVAPAGKSDGVTVFIPDNGRG